jgi:annexin A7/11
MSTVVIPPDLSSPRDDAIKLKAAFQGFGCNTKEVVRILAHRDAMQRTIIQQEYRALYGDELAHRLSSELSGDLKVCIDSMPDIRVCKLDSCR